MPMFFNGIWSYVNIIFEIKAFLQKLNLSVNKCKINKSC